MNLSRRPGRQQGDGGESPLARFRGDMDTLFDRFFRDPWWGGVQGAAGEQWLTPRLDVAESEDSIALRVELPGVRPEDIHIDVTGDMLTLRGEKREQKSEQGHDFRYMESQYGSFTRTVQLPGSVDPENVDASYRDGILTITLTKRPDAKPKRIQVRSGDTIDAGGDFGQQARMGGGTGGDGGQGRESGAFGGQGGGSGQPPPPIPPT